jgi:hypothetical protein
MWKSRESSIDSWRDEDTREDKYLSKFGLESGIFLLYLLNEEAPGALCVPKQVYQHQEDNGIVALAIILVGVEVKV